MASNVPIILNIQAVFTNHEDICSVPLYFSEILAEALFSEVVPLGHFHRAVDSQGVAIIFFWNSHRSLDFRSRAIRTLSQSDGFERG